MKRLGTGEGSLEEIVQNTYRAGMAYAQVKQEAEYCENMRPILRAQIMERLDDGNLSEAKLKRLAEMDREWILWTEKWVKAKGEAEKLKIRYEAYKNFFEARRSLMSYQKAEMRFL